MTRNCSCHEGGGKYAATVPALLERPRYATGLILEESDLTASVEYTRSLSRLLFRNLFGCGVICGLLVSVDEECGLSVTVAPGLALDGHGDPVQVPAPIAITLDRTELANRFKPPAKAEFWVVLCGGEKMCAPRALACESEEYDDVTQPTRIRSLAQVSLAFERPKCICECRPPDSLAVKPEQPGNPAVPHPSAAMAEEIDCHRDHETRVGCAPDCGCGTACGCGCCLLLAHVVGARDPVTGKVAWRAICRGVRRFIRTKLLPDPADREEGTTELRPRTGAAPDTNAVAGKPLGTVKATEGDA